MWEKVLISGPCSYFTIRFLLNSLIVKVTLNKITKLGTRNIVDNK